jgi:hypothetical protein
VPDCPTSGGLEQVDYRRRAVLRGFEIAQKLRLKSESPCLSLRNAPTTSKGSWPSPLLLRIPVSSERRNIRYLRSQYVSAAMSGPTSPGYGALPSARRLGKLFSWASEPIFAIADRPEVRRQQGSPARCPT